jgi:pyruvate dehydrogenase E2 component (dihydrolipoamide acetyltransferase)
MAHEFHLPDIGEGLTEAVVVQWHVGVGDPVGIDEPLVEVETDKAVVDIPSPVAGVVLHHGAGPGDTIEVESLLAVIGAADEEWEQAIAAPQAESAALAAIEAAPIVGTLGDATAPATQTGAQALPRVRKLAADIGVDLETVAGTGPGGRVTEEDVLAAARPTSHRGPVERRPMSATRRTIAERLARSWREIPHVTTYADADASGLLRWRAELDRPALEALLVQVLVPLLRRHPEFNATLEGNDVVEKHYYDIGVAIDAPDGLMVGVLRDAGDRSVPDLDVAIRSLAERVRERSATADDLRGQTFTLSNIGAVGGGFGTPIIPLGTTAIVSFGRATDRAVARHGSVDVAPMLPISLSYDHRVIDGARGRAFMAALVEAIEAL